eukprot:Colp12_sorted_trinity150504_noHs@5623
MSDKKGKRINSLQYHANTPKFILDMQAKLGGGNERRVRNPEDYNSEEEEEREDREDEKPQVVVLDEKKHLSQEEAEALKKRKRDEEREDIDAKTGKHTFRRTAKAAEEQEKKKMKKPLKFKTEGSTKASKDTSKLSFSFDDE